MALFSSIGALAGITSAATFWGAVGTCLLTTNLEEFDMREYNDRH